MRTCLSILAILGIIAGLFGIIPILAVHLPDMKTIRPGEMVVTGVKSIRMGSGSNNHATGHIKGDGRKAFFGDVDKLCDYIGFCDMRFTDTLKSDSPPVIPVWYTDRGYAMSRFEKNSPRPDNRNIIKALKRLSFFFIPALIVLMMYFYERWKTHFVWLLIGHLYTSSLAAQTQQNLSDFRETIPLSVQLSSVCRAYAHDYGPTGLPVHGCFRSAEAVDLSYPEQVFESMMSSTSAACPWPTPTARCPTPVSTSVAPAQPGATAPGVQPQLRSMSSTLKSRHVKPKFMELHRHFFTEFK